MGRRDSDVIRNTRAVAFVMVIGAFLVGALVAYVLSALGLREALAIGLLAFVVSYVIGVVIWLHK